MKYQGTCQCGKVRIGILSDPFLKYNCHCSHCRAFASKYCTFTADAAGKSCAANGAPFHAGVFVWRWSVLLEEDGNESIEYEYTSSLGGLFGLARGRCAGCKQPVWERGRHLAAPYAMVMAPPLMNVLPDTNIFYNSGLRQGTEDLPRTIYSDLGSWLFQIWIVLSVALPQLPSSIFDYFLVAKRSPTHSNRKED
jgi:hypothetical protein